jgi:membrane-bound ClpP family serine protease
MDDEIYIDCQPTGNSQEKMDVVFNEPANPSINNLGDIINNPLVQLVLLTITIILLIYMFFRLDNYIARK